MIAKGYQILLETAWDVIFTLTLDGRVTSANWAFQLVTGYPTSAWEGRLLVEMAHPEDASALQACLSDVSSGELRPPLSVRLLAQSGLLILSEMAFARVEEEGQEPVLLAAARDVTERRRAEELLRDRENRFQELVEGTRAVPFEADCLQRRFTYVGPQAVALLGYDVGTWCSGNFWFEHVHPGDRRLVDRFPAGSGNEADEEDFVYRMLAVDGRIVWILHLARRQPGRHLCRGFLLDVTARHQALAELERSREQHRALAAQLQIAGEQERLHVAREIHDELGQALTCIRMDALSMKRELELLPAAQGTVLAQRMTGLEQMATETMRAVRRIATNLRPPILDRIGLFAAIEWQTSDFEQRFRLACHLERSLEEPSLDGDRATAVFRIFQELLTNIAKHAEATAVKVSLRSDLREVRLRVVDNGRGFAESDLQKANAFGVLGMKERVTAFGGTLEIIGGRLGTQVAMSMPIKTASAIDHS